MTRTLLLLFFSLVVCLLPGCSGCDDDDDDPIPRPAVPTGLILNAPSSGRIDITWTDASGNETGFRIECSPDNVTYTEVGAVGANVENFTHRGLTPNTAYWYQVRAINGTGPSAYLGPLMTTTQNVAWSALPAGPTREEHTAVYDSVGQRMIMFGGWDPFTFVVYDEVWELTLGVTPAWNQLTPTGGPVPAKVQHTAILDTANQRVIVFGGGDDFLLPQNDVWELTLGGTPNWTGLAPTGGPPGARIGHTAIYDGLNQRMIVFGGNAGAGALNDVWEMSLPAAGPPVWNQLSPTGMLTREEHSAAYDPINQRMLVFGGRDGAGTLQNDVWELTLPTAGVPAWTQLPATGGPPAARAGTAATMDLTDQRFAFFSGQLSGPAIDTETWMLNPLDTPAWTLTAPGGAGPPPGRFGHSAIYDSANHRMIIYGGDDGTLFAALADTWALDY